MKIGIVGDIHGDLAGYQATMQIFLREGVDHIVCPGDIVDRGAAADEIVADIKARQIPCILGNHEVTVARNQDKYRQMPPEKLDRLRGLGRIVANETLTFIQGLPETWSQTISGVRILMAHGTPYSDIVGVFPDSKFPLFQRLSREYGDVADVMILGHTHTPMNVQMGALKLVNAGSVYGVTMRDSATCAILTLPSLAFQVFNWQTGSLHPIEQIDRSTR